MTREEAIKHLGTYSSTLGSGQTSQEQHEEAKRVAIENLEKTRWIPVTERAPDKDGLYLVSVKNEHLRNYSKTCWYSDKNWFARQDVVAWQPLPEPYKTESEDEDGSNSKYGNA